MLTQKVQAKNIERNILVVHNGLKNYIMEKTKPNNLILDLTGNYYNDTLKDSSKRTQSEMKGTESYPERDLQVRLWIISSEYKISHLVVPGSSVFFKCQKFRQG
jgi:uncharacterized membrane protein